MRAIGFSFRATLASGTTRTLFYAVLCLISFSFAPISSSAASVSNNTVSIKSYAFTPATVTIAVGGTVTWINQDDDPHTVKSVEPDATLKSAALDTNDKYSQTFTKPGVYKYFCTLHPHMQGEIIVQ